MNNDNRTMNDPARRADDLRRGRRETDVSVALEEDEVELEDAEEEFACYSLVSADRMRKVSLVLHFIDLDAQALTYSYLVSTRWTRSKAIKMDFSGYAVEIEGRNLRPIFDGLATQRLASVREIDDLQARANLPEDATVVTKITITEIK